jgi:hypothetical protein
MQHPTMTHFEIERIWLPQQLANGELVKARAAVQEVAKHNRQLILADNAPVIKAVVLVAVTNAMHHQMWDVGCLTLVAATRAVVEAQAAMAY